MFVSPALYDQPEHYELNYREVLVHPLLVLPIQSDMHVCISVNRLGNRSFKDVVCNRLPASGVPRNFFQEGRVQQIQLRTEERENGDMGAAVIWYKKFHFIW